MTRRFQSAAMSVSLRKLSACTYVFSDIIDNGALFLVTSKTTSSSHAKLVFFSDDDRVYVISDVTYNGNLSSVTSEQTSLYHAKLVLGCF